MNYCFLLAALLILLSLLSCAPTLAQEATVERPDWQQHFAKYDVQGTIVILDARESQPQRLVYNPVRAKQRYSPASTFKIPHSLFALDSSLVKDEFQVFPWNGVKHGYRLHNRDQTLRSAMRYSTVWVFDEFARQLGEAKSRQYLEQIDYGNTDPRTSSGSYWIDGKLAISAHEQLDFLQRLYENALPFPLAHQLLVKDLMINEAGKQWILRAKTGWHGRHGWWVGWVEWPGGPVFFALNIGTPNRGKDLYKRQAIVREILWSLKALPAPGK